MLQKIKQIKFRLFFDSIALSLRRNNIVLLSFSIPIIILLIAYAFRLIFPFGDRDLMMIDLYHQYAPFLAGLREKFVSFSGLQYSWNGGLGTTFLALYAYYLASPLNIIVVLFPKEFLTEAVFALILLKVGLSGAFFSIYLKGVYKERKLSIVAFSIMYALSAYLISYSWNIMWIDCVYILPLVILGIVKIARKETGFLFCISLAIMIFSNFYIAFFGCIFVILYYPICLLQYNSLRKPADLLKITGKFVGYGILSVGLTAALIIPTYFALKLTSAIGDSFPRTFDQYYKFLDFFQQHLTLAKPTIRDGMPNMYSGISVLILVPLYFMSRNIKHKVKLMHAVLLLFLLSSFNFNILNFIWHGFHFPNQLPFRNSFIYIFFVLSMAYPGYRNIKEFTGKQIGSICGVLILLIFIFQKFSQPEMDLFIFYVSIVFIMIYAGVLTIHKRPGYTRSLPVFIFLIVVILEISTHTFVSIDTIDNVESYAGREGYAAGDQVDQIRAALDDIEKNDDSFYRVETFPPRTTNDPYLYGYNGFSIFSSTFQEKTVKSIQDLGFHSNGINSYKYEGSTILIDSLFGIKYLLKRTHNINDVLRTEISSTNQLTVLKNPYAISLGFYAPAEILDWNTESSDPFRVQGSLAKSISGIEGVFESLELEEGENKNLSFSSFSSSYIRFSKDIEASESIAKILIIPEMDQQIYFSLDISPNKADHGYVMLNGKRINFNAKRSTVVDLGYCLKDSKIEINMVYSSTSSETGNFKIRAYSLNKEVFEETMDIISDNSFVVDKYTDTKVLGHINAPEKGVVIMTIPFDKGWSVQIDNEKAETIAFDDALLSFEISQGYHDIKLKFVTQKFPYSLTISIFSFVVLLYLFILYKKKLKVTLD